MNETERLFTDLKEKQKTITDDELNAIFAYSLSLATKFKATGQTAALRKLVYVMDSIGKEKQLIKLGIDTYIYKDEIDYYIDSFSTESKPIKIIELEYYTRDIPDEIAQVVEKTKDIFDEFFVLYTDYADSDGKRIEAEKRSTDPILLGVFINQQKRVCIDRFYVLGDWLDPYCDLTLEAFVTNMASKGKDAQHTIYCPSDLNELRAYLDSHKEKDGNIVFDSTPISLKPILDKKRSWFDKVKAFFKL